jgi:hypothetical protein
VVPVAYVAAVLEADGVDLAVAVAEYANAD